ncbi:MAG: SlyX family protein [Pseudomonadota bacterium]
MNGHDNASGEISEAELNLDGLKSGKSAEERLDDLEIALAHQANIIEELNSVIAEHSETIAELKRKLDILNRRTAVTEMQIRDITPVEKPPHW